MRKGMRWEEPANQLQLLHRSFARCHVTVAVLATRSQDSGLEADS